ncbi:MAG: hypothetical protein QF689_06480 [Candidatus Latescibacteria bacterium]|nr:hypothetical protein [Candidatus Latescibacterota bacterium]MDP7448211.1 hypothetical protein [Candidatus Latescibacterota bacterium]
MINSRIAPVVAGLTVSLFLSGPDQAQARNFRLGMVPNTAATEAGCNLCHTSGGGTPRNSFGLDVQSLVTANGREVFWGPELAALDSDGDGVPNGVELGDPDGSWEAGDDPPGDAASITHPGDETSFIEQVTAVSKVTWAAVKRIASDLAE